MRSDDDVATYYFIIKDDREGKCIQGWTDRKELAKAYMEFHHCKNFRLTSMTASMKDIVEVINENLYDEISIQNLIIRNEDRKPGRECKYVYIPMTETETMFVRDECSSLAASSINYSLLESAFSYLKPKYQKALQQIWLDDAMMHVIHSKPSNILKCVGIDELQIMLTAFRGNFG